MSLAALNKYSLDVFSNDKQTRQTARAGLIRLTEKFKKVTPIPYCERGKYPYWADLSQRINRTLTNHTIDYSVDHYSAPSKFEYNEYEDHPEIRQCNEKEDNTNPAFVVMMTHGVSPNRSSSRPLISQITKLQEEGFGRDVASSLQMADLNLRIVVCINYEYAVDHERNQRCKQYIKDIFALASSTVSIVPMKWMCHWKKGSEIADLKEVKRYLRLVENIDKRIYTIVLNNIEFNKMIPMQMIREGLMDHDYVGDHLDALQAAAPERDTFVMTCDDDIDEARAEGDEGLFTHYTRLIEENPRVLIASTGYRIFNKHNNYPYLASLLDRQIRIILQNAAYFCEPNTIFNAKIYEHLNFMRENKFAAKGGEFIGIVENLINDKIDLENKMIIGAEGPLTTSGDRVVIPDCFREGVTAENLKRNILQFRYFMQASFNPEVNLAPGFIRTIPQLQSKVPPVYKENIYHLTRIFAPFDPINLSEFFPGIWDKIYIPIQEAMIEMMNDYHLGERTFDYSASANKIIKCSQVDRHVKSRIESFLHNALGEYAVALNYLADKDLTAKQIGVVVNKCFAVGSHMYSFFMKIMNGEIG